MKCKKALTLAEIMLVMFIIGIVAMETIPSLVNNFRNSTYTAGVKAAFSMLSQAHRGLIADYGSTKAALAECSSDEDEDCFKDIIKQYFSYLKECADEEDGCFAETVYGLNGSDITYNNRIIANTNPGLILKNGMTMEIDLDSRTCNGTSPKLEDACAEFVVDVNGFNGPNTAGRDIYNFQMKENNIVPLGTGEWDYDGTCNTSSTGLGCAAYIMTNGTIDY